jgi:hypothetical protein
MKNPHVALRIASVIGLLFAAGHTAGAPWTPANKGVAADGLVMMMKKIHFDVMGTERTYFDFYSGFGVSISVCLLALAIILWQVGDVVKVNPASARPILLTMFVAYIALGVVSAMYIFAAPLVFSAAICALIAWAWAKAGR